MASHELSAFKCPTTTSKPKSFHNHAYDEYLAMFLKHVITDDFQQRSLTKERPNATAVRLSYFTMSSCHKRRQNWVLTVCELGLLNLKGTCV